MRSEIEATGPTFSLYVRVEVQVLCHAPAIVAGFLGLGSCTRGRP